MDTRKSPRAKLKVRIKLDCSANECFNIIRKEVEGEMIDIGLLGLALLSKYFFPVGVELKLNFAMPSAPNIEENKGNDTKNITVCGVVRYAISGGKGLIRVGVKFIDLSEEDRNIIASFIRGS